jgi:hypothetical protein
VAGVTALIMGLVVGFLSLESQAAAQSRVLATQVLERDLAVLLPSDDELMRIGLKDVGFGVSWYRALEDTFSQTSVGPALQNENRYEDWRLVAARLVPCQSRLARPMALGARICWPEVRLVLQPIVRRVEAAGRVYPYFADDRAVHLTFDYVAPGRDFPAALLSDLNRVAEDLSSTATEMPADHEQALRRLEGVRDGHVEDLLGRVLILRTDKSSPEAFRGVELRPEYALDPDERRAFTQRLLGFLSTVQGGAPLPREVTAFSLPEGREPAHLDDWVFLRFEPETMDRLVATPITVRSAQDASILFETPDTLGQRVTMARDDDAVYEALERFKGTTKEEEFRKNMILFIPDIRANRERLADGSQVRVANTTCGSCHKLGPLRFDLHSLSYLQGEPMTISQRVQRDVAFDLEWLGRWVKSR